MPNRVTPNQATLPIRDDRETLEVVRRKLGFRAWHRGTREADLLMGAFADQCLADFGAEELRQFERLLEEDDPSSMIGSPAGSVLLSGTTIGSWPRFENFASRFRRALDARSVAAS